jgi:hypothetical protein
MADPLKIITKVMSSSECAIDKGGAVCSPKHVISDMAKMIQSNSQQVPTDNHAILEKAKQITECESESCVLLHHKFKKVASSSVDKILDEFFKPEGPAMNFGLLSNYNIDEFLEQLTKRHTTFLHIPFQMRDFEKTRTELATIDLTKHFKNGKKKFGVVLNTDWSHGGGIHWYCLFGEHHGSHIVLEYFNSSGRDPLVETQAWLHKTKHHIHSTLRIPTEIKYSTGVLFQNDDHSCGVYCLMYIWLRLEGVPASWFNARNFNDEFMHKARKVLFRHCV